MKSPNKKRTAKAQPASNGHALNFFAEAGLLKRVKRSGWWVAGIKDPESVAEHSFRCAVIGYYLAHLEQADVYQVLVMTLFNDIHEARINDLHKMGHFYIDFKDAEKKVFKQQVMHLDGRLKRELSRIREKYDRQITLESIVARDADILECLLQAKEYYEAGHVGVKEFFNRAPDHLKTKSAQILWKSIKTWKSDDWWKKIVKFER